MDVRNRQQLKKKLNEFVSLLLFRHPAAFLAARAVRRARRRLQGQRAATQRRRRQRGQEQRVLVAPAYAHSGGRPRAVPAGPAIRRGAKDMRADGPEVKKNKQKRKQKAFF